VRYRGRGVNAILIAGGRIATTLEFVVSKFNHRGSSRYAEGSCRPKIDSLRNLTEKKNRGGHAEKNIVNQGINVYTGANTAFRKEQKDLETLYDEN